MKPKKLFISVLITLAFLIIAQHPQEALSSPDIKIDNNLQFVTETKFPDRSKEAEVAKQIDVQREKARLEALRQAELQKQAQVQAQAQKPATVAQNTPTDANSAKMFIYMKESGNNPQARNAGGCLGLGQACPGSKLLAVCPNLDYACQDAFFTNYALSRYGSWEGALAFWQSHFWW